VFDHEKLEVYKLQLKFVGWVAPLLEEVRQDASGKTREVRDHLDRSSLSTLFNIAEGNGKRRRQTRAKFFDDARGSASESAACLDALVAKGVCSVNRIGEGKQMLERVFAMLTKLIERFDENT
jgi:four helix bundle protein